MFFFHIRRLTAQSCEMPEQAGQLVCTASSMCLGLLPHYHVARENFSFYLGNMEAAPMGLVRSALPLEVAHSWADARNQRLLCTTQGTNRVVIYHIRLPTPRITLPTLPPALECLLPPFPWPILPPLHGWAWPVLKSFQMPLWRL